jgi:hypothetical protein
MNKRSVPELASEFIDKFQSAKNPFYTYGTTIVEPLVDPDTGTGRLRPITVRDLKWYVRRVYPDQTEGTINAVAEDILHNPELPLQRIRGLVTTPTFREDFSLVPVPGFDSVSGLYYSPDPSLQKFTFLTNASKSNAKASLEDLFELLTDFLSGMDKKSIRTSRRFSLCSHEAPYEVSCHASPSTATGNLSVKDCSHPCCR